MTHSFPTRLSSGLALVAQDGPIDNLEPGLGLFAAQRVATFAGKDVELPFPAIAIHDESAGNLVLAFYRSVGDHHVAHEVPGARSGVLRPAHVGCDLAQPAFHHRDRKSTRLNSRH